MDNYVAIREDERIDDLQCDGLTIIQRKGGFCFGIDAVLLSGYAKVKRGERVLDMCCGNGVIPLLLSAKSKASEYVGVEYQQEVAELAARSVAMNKLEDRIKIINADIKNIKDYLDGEFEVITCNPPYMKVGNGAVSDFSTKAIARHEIMCNIDDVFAAAGKMLKYGGRMYIVHRPERLCDIVTAAREHKIEPKNMRMVHTHIDKAPVLLLMELLKGGAASLKVDKPLIIYGEDGKYTPEVNKIYYGE
jgi:tRNA1Val (adenine37-N6)-methyltransferase